MNIKKLKNKLLKTFTPFIYISGLKHPIKNIETTFKVNKKFKSYKGSNEYLEIKEINIFRKSFIKFVWAQSKDSDLPFLFLDAKIKVAKKNFDVKEVKNTIPILICPVKDDLERIKMSLEYYRNIGIKYFVYIDNLSKDGTFEFLNEQPDVNTYICETPYTTLNREAWINRIISYYGFDRWYICVDSDELFVYENMEEKDIETYIKSLDFEKNRRVKAILLDMYSMFSIFNKKIQQDDIRKYYCYFDKDSYYQIHTYKLDLIKGGPRKRVFFRENNSNTLTKYPLFFFKKGDIQCCSHFQFPYKPNCDVPCTTALLHYKFLYSDLSKYIERARLKNYSNGSIEYKTYVQAYQNNNDIILYDIDRSVRFENSSSLKKIESIFNQ